MTLPARIVDLDQVITDLRTLITNCDADVAAADPDSAAIQKIREEASAAMGALGFQTGEPQ